ncbi:hypothetical protein ASF44_10085 [Pseudorhodoferax sp. Leaf274]|nr:hypothetical protein ASF44_10085 [Pseudorhodoferax sp. Leaf274]
MVDIGVNFHSAQLVSLTDQLLMRARAEPANLPWVSTSAAELVGRDVDDAGRTWMPDFTS